VALAWLAVLAAALAGAGHVGGRLSQQFSLPGQPGYEANQRILRAYHNGGQSAPLVPVITLPAGTTVDSPGVRARLARGFGAVARNDHAVRVVSYSSAGDRGFVANGGRTTFGLVFTPGTGRLDDNQSARAAAITATLRAAVPGSSVWVTGLPALSGGGRSSDPGVVAETLLGALGALAVLALVFGSLLALVPLLVAAAAILTTFLLVLGLTLVTDVSFLAQYLIALIGLGVAIDYSLLMVTRWREERARGCQNRAAVVLAMGTAGRAIGFSAVTVAVGLIALVALPVPFLRSLGYGGILIPLVSAAVSLTLLPVLLASIGPRADWPRGPRGDRTSRLWTRWARLVIRHRLAAVAFALAVLGALAAAATGMHVGDPSAASLAHDGPAFRALVALERAGIPSGVLTPIEVITGGGVAPGRAVGSLGALPGVYAVSAPPGPAWHRGGTSLTVVLPAAETSMPAGQPVLGQVRSDLRRSAPDAAAGGEGAQTLDFVHAVYGHFLLMLALIAGLTWILLARAFRSVLLPLKAIALNLLSAGAVYGALVLVWQDGHGSLAIWGIPATGAITDFVPLMIFAFLFGLSMDYEVFLLTSIREARDAGLGTDAAIAEGLGRTGRLITSAALILCLAFAALAAGPQTDIKVFATGLGAGILLDATVVRALLVPALMSLLGPRNWWLPGWVARLLLVRPRAAQISAVRPSLTTRQAP